MLHLPIDRLPTSEPAAIELTIVEAPPAEQKRTQTEVDRQSGTNRETDAPSERIAESALQASPERDEILDSPSAAEPPKPNVEVVLEDPLHLPEGQIEEDDTRPQNGFDGSRVRPGSNPSDLDSLAEALGLSFCNRLARDQSDTCPPPDPFSVAEARAEREAYARNPMEITYEAPQGRVERFFALQKHNRHMFPGMNAHMFGDPMPPGAYDAQRIRNGQDPLWSDEKRRSFVNPASEED